MSSCSGSYERCSYRDFSIFLDPQVGFCFTDGVTVWAARSPAHAILRIDAILLARSERVLQVAMAAAGASSVQ